MNNRQALPQENQLQISILYVLVLQVMNGHCQLSESTGPDDIFSILEAPDGALGNA
jgi:hypothetical protein